MLLFLRIFMHRAILVKVGIPSIISVQDKSYVTIGNKTYPSHDLEDYEMNASKRAKKYFEKYYGIMWDESKNPTFYPQAINYNFKY